MAAAIATTEGSSSVNENNSPNLELLQAPFVLRCAGIFIDYLVLLAFPVIWLITGLLLSENGVVVIPLWVWTIAVILFLCNFIILPLLRGRTLGKMILGLTILSLDGTPVRLGQIIKRNLLGYFVTLLTAGLGFLLVVVSPSGRALHDIIGGTIVIKGKRLVK